MSCEEQALTRIEDGCYECLPRDWTTDGRPIRRTLTTRENYGVLYYYCTGCGGYYGPVEEKRT
jgi:hypothetical protein